ncbi:PspC domain-containing protein [Thermococcus sp. AM4]|uniref:PspC domain-containing protein n=1 Tax=Thermococcus sp. (strain AM4) TaxID=246969 RepID=UPI000187081B|nr:transcription regulator, PspC family [Thermococcus sp. AM4]
MTEGGKKLKRSKTNRMFLGVLGGLAEYLNVDPTILRVIFVVLLVFNPVTMTLLYLLAALVIPEEGEEEKPLSEGIKDIGEEVNRVVSSDDSLIKAVIAVVVVIAALYLITFFLPLMLVLPSRTVVMISIPLGLLLAALVLVLLIKR